MLEVSVAIPDSALSDETTKLDKSRKISLIARSCAIFKVKNIYIYDESGDYQDKNLLVTILKYLDTPQYLRKKLFPKMNELKFAGVLAPLKTPSHLPATKPQMIKTGDIREGIIYHTKGKKLVDVGINQMLPYYGKTEHGKRVTIQFKEGYPNLSITEITRDKIPTYWGYTVKKRGNLFTLLSSWHGKAIITSRKGINIVKERKRGKIPSEGEVLVVFGSPTKGIYDILGKNIKKIQNSVIVNFFPNQGTETVRLEEAILGTLSILNSYSDY